MTAAEGADPAEVERLVDVVVATPVMAEVRRGALWHDDARAIVRAVLAAQQQPTGDDRLADLAEAVAEAYTREGVAFWWTSWARYPEYRSSAEAGVLQEWSGEPASLADKYGRRS